MKKIIVLFMMIITAVSLAACGSEKAKDFDMNADWDTIVKEADGQKVSFYGFGGNEDLNKWIDSELAVKVKEKYNITLDRVPMDIDEILSKLSAEKQAGTSNGVIDMIWINGENFYSTKENALLMGAFAGKLPNFNQYIDKDSDSTKMDFGYPIEEYEVPYSKAQMVLINDSEKTPETPKSADELLEYAKKYKGKVTYAALPDFTGSAFVRNIIYDVVGYEEFFTMEADKETVKAYIQPAIDYLNELKPYLWNEGKTYPATNGQVENMYADGELVMSISYEPYTVALNIEKNIFTETSRSFLFDKGTIGNTNYITIAKNAPNKAGAMVVINEMLTPELQVKKYEQAKLLTAIDYPLLSDDEKEMFDNVNIGKGILDSGELSSKQLPEIPAKFVPIIEEIWLEEVAGQ